MYKKKLNKVVSETTSTTPERSLSKNVEKNHSAPKLDDSADIYTHGDRTRLVLPADIIFEINTKDTIGSKIFGKRKFL